MKLEKTNALRLATLPWHAKGSAIALMICLSLPAHAQLVVTSLGDDVDNNPGDTVCDTDLGGCTLRAAVDEANEAAGEQTISFDVSGVLTLDHPFGTIDIEDDLQIVGPGSELLVVRQGLIYGGIFATGLKLPNVTISGMTISDAQTAPGVESRAGTNVILMDIQFVSNNRHAVSTQGQVLIDACVFDNNIAPSGPAINIFGAEGSGNVTVRQSIFQNNQATGGVGGAIRMDGSQHFLSIEDSTFTNNFAKTAGGAISGVGSLLIARSLFTGNETGPGSFSYSGGAINYIDSSSIPHRFAMANTIISENYAGHHGGGINIVSTGAVEITQSAFVRNETEAFGGGIALGGLGNGGQSLGAHFIANTTLSGNTAPSGAGASVGREVDVNFVTFLDNNGGALDIDGPGVTVRNTIVARGAGAGADCTGAAFTVAGPNLDSDGSCGFDFTQADPFLADLSSEGSLPPTHIPQLGSLAIDNADSADCAAEPILNRDQRGVARPLGLACDLGAHEASETILAAGFELVSGR